MPIDLTAPAERPPSRPARRPSHLSGRMVLACMVGFFLVIAGVNAAMMTIAIRTMPGVDVKSAYETSQRFNGEIARMQAQADRGWQAGAELRRIGADAAVTLSLRDRTGAPVTGLAVRARLEHPAARREDHEATLGETAAGDYATTIPSVHGGGWTLAITATRGEEQVFVSRSRVILKD
ncbi:MAG TPA: FixH family protein [Bosea sp. (in: a-proteobacteria)]|uniref:FixH family protein n=1 Tax=Bosea sp. (in: a-proteobacteria) TaxID=1871050 RepID=UPI002E15D153|nr:FixH family protein [Bosea sp. (in: a-proteobacteria)]